MTRITRRLGIEVATSMPSTWRLPLVDDVEGAERTSAVERIGHEVEGPDVVQSIRRCQWQSSPLRQATFDSSRQIELHRAVHPMQRL
jgi:hypothetical protein